MKRALVSCLVDSVAVFIVYAALTAVHPKGGGVSDWFSSPTGKLLFAAFMIVAAINIVIEWRPR